MAYYLTWLSSAVSTPLQSLAAGMSAGDWAEVTVTGLDASMFIAGATKTYDYCNKMAYDTVGQRLLWIGQGHNERQDWYAFDEASETFSVLSDPPWDDGGSSPPSYIGHGFQHNTCDTSTGDFYYQMTAGATNRQFVRSSSTWNVIDPSQTSGNGIGGFIEWHPGIGTQGGMIGGMGEYVWRWDKASDSTATVTSSLPNPQNHLMGHYSAPGGVVLFGGGNGDSNALYSVGASGGYSTRTSCPIDMGVQFAITACCPVSGDLLVWGGVNGARQYDEGTDTWSTLSTTGAPSFGTIGAGSGIIASPVPAYGVVAVLFCSAAELWIYKHA